MKRTTSLVLLVLLAACAAQPVTGTVTPPAATATAIQATSDPSITIVDALNRTVVLPALPQRIVITGKALFMLADAAYLFPQAPQRIIAMGNAGQGPGNFIQLIDPAYAEKAILAGDAGAEQVAALQPDLVLLKSYLAETVGAPIEALGIPVLYIDFETPEQYARDLAILGKIFGDETRAAEVAAYYQSRMDAIRAAVQGAARPRTLLLYYSDKDGAVSFNVPPLTWIQTRMVEMAGGEPVWADANPGKGWTQVSLEQVAAWDPDQVFVISYFRPAPQVVQELQADPNWQSIRALQEGHLQAFPADLFSWDQPDPRWVLGLTWLAGRLHPGRFPGLEMTAEAQEFYQSLYGLEAGFFNENILPTFKGVLP